MQKFEQRYLEGNKFWFAGNYVVYFPEPGTTGCTKSCSQWMVPGTWQGEHHLTDEGRINGKA